MSKTRKIGVILILVGFCIPLVSLCFINAGYNPQLGFLFSLSRMEIVLKEKEPICYADLNLYSDSMPKPGGLSRRELAKMAKDFADCNRRAIPYAPLLAAGIMFVLVGVGVVMLSGPGHVTAFDRKSRSGEQG